MWYFHSFDPSSTALVSYPQSWPGGGGGGGWGGGLIVEAKLGITPYKKHFSCSMHRQLRIPIGYFN